MINTAELIPIAIGTGIGSTVAGLAAYSMNYAFEVQKPESSVIVVGYIWILTLGIISSHGNFITVLLSTTIGVRVFGKFLFTHLVKDRLPKPTEKLDY